jgi:ABC-type Zn2+ transport system substrate-binding protein/surface adhesin
MFGATDACIEPALIRLNGLFKIEEENKYKKEEEEEEDDEGKEEKKEEEEEKEEEEKGEEEEEEDEKKERSWTDGPNGKTMCCQVKQTEFDSWYAHSGRKELTSEKFPLISTCTRGHAYTHTYTHTPHMHTHTLN